MIEENEKDYVGHIKMFSFEYLLEKEKRIFYKKRKQCWLQL